MSKQQELLERIQAEFQPHFATVENESHMHVPVAGLILILN